MDLFEFTDDKVAGRFKPGYIFQTTSQNRISFESGKGTSKGCIKLVGSSSARDGRFLIYEPGELRVVEEMIDRGFSLKHDGILKPLLCASSCQLPKVVSGFGLFNQTLPDWLSAQNAIKVNRSAYLLDFQKDMVRYGLEAIEEIWEKGYTCDGLDLPASYVIIGGRLNPRIKILPSVIRSRLPGETDKMVLRFGFANLLKNEIVPLWAKQVASWVGDELNELIDLIKNANARLEEILGHPVLSSPGRRLILYRSFDHMTLKQINTLNTRIQMNPNWKTIACQDSALRKIIGRQTLA